MTPIAFLRYFESCKVDRLKAFGAFYGVFFFIKGLNFYCFWGKLRNVNEHFFQAILVIVTFTDLTLIVAVDLVATNFALGLIWHSVGFSFHETKLK